MIKYQLQYEWLFFSRKRSWYVMMVFFFAIGLLITGVANFSFPDTYRNSSYVLTYLMGLLSLISIFTATQFAALCLFREKDVQFDAILYALPLKKHLYIGCRLVVVFGVGLLCFFLLVTGIMTGHLLHSGNDHDFGNFHIWNYWYPFLVLVVPNIFICTAVVCSIAWLTNNKLIVYVSGLFLYFLYIGMALFTNSPLMAGSSPVSAEAMRWSARLDPFGLSAFYEQTRYWSSAQRNTDLLQLKGNFLINRLLYLLISGCFVVLAYCRWQFALTTGKRNHRIKKVAAIPTPGIPYRPVATQQQTIRNQVFTIWSCIRMDVQPILKGWPFWLICIGYLCFQTIEIFSSIKGGTREPEHFATTSLVFGNILSGFPVIGLMIILFYGMDTFWRSHASRFNVLEESTPVNKLVIFFSKSVSLAIIPFILISVSISCGIVFQLIYNYPVINWHLYASLYYLLGWPLTLSAVCILSIHAFVQNKYLALSVAAIFLLFTNTTVANLAGIHHPLFRFANAYQGPYSEMNGFGAYLPAFHIKMIYWTAITTMIALIAVRTKKWMLIIPFIVSIISGLIIYQQTTLHSKEEVNDHKQAYEQKYRRWQNKAMPVIKNVKTAIDLYPSNNSYRVAGEYILVNTTNSDIDSILIYADKNLQGKGIIIDQAALVIKDEAEGQYIFKPASPMKPGDSLAMKFFFQYRWSAFSGHEPFNAIVENGSFMRISNYFPQIGYQSANEINDVRERRKRNLASATPLPKLEERSAEPFDYGFINLDATISTEGNQTAIGIGELKNKWSEKGRNYFHYQTMTPVPFRFAVASGAYAEKQINYAGINIKAYYHPGHNQNISHMLETAKQTLAYCEQHFGDYPFKTLRIVEISSFTKGFAGTAYPTSFFINEDVGFQHKAKGNVEKDIINEIVSHELAHTWWGNAQISPEYREGSKILTETLAMYTELMIYKKIYGEENILHRVQLHKDIYLRDRVLLNEEPLFKAHPEKHFLSYDKGMVVMYQLFKLIGEDNMNKALKHFFQKHVYPKQPPVTQDLLNELWAVTDSHLHDKIDELFREIITYELGFQSVIASKQPGNIFLLHIRGYTQKFSEDGKGNKKEVPFSENIEAIIYCKNKPSRSIQLTAKDGIINMDMTVNDEPVLVRLDPDVLFMDLSSEDNERNVEWR